MSTGSMAFKSDQFEAFEYSKKLETIDRLRELGIGEEISLPQLVVVGDQSSGKSSLLEGLTELPFPVASQLCTRFVTQVSFRRSAESKEVVNVSIIPNPDAGDKYKKELAAFNRNIAPFSAEGFAVLLDQAAACMGLTDSKGQIDPNSKRFSSDVLKIELVGPSQPFLTVVDVPGLYHNPTKEQTEADLILIRKLIQRYVQDQRTIILAVLDSRNNLANQEVFRIAKAADHHGFRTVGIMTKLDASQQGDEPAALKIAMNKTEILKHGWYCVRNRTTEEINFKVSLQERHENERSFFLTAPWNTLDKKRTGIENLKHNLGRLLANYIAQEFPHIRKELDAKHVCCSEELSGLGLSRQTSQEQMQFLVKLANAYQKLIEDAVAGRYSEHGKHPSKVRMLVQNAGDGFSSKMLRHGYTVRFKTSDDDVDLDEGESPLTVFRSSHDDNVSRSIDDSDSDKYDAEEIDEPAEPALGKNDEDDNERDEWGSDDNIYKLIKDHWLTSRGTELPGHANPSVFENLFRFQTASWVSIASDHFQKIVQIIKESNTIFLEKACADRNVFDKISSRIETETDEAIAAAEAELYRLLNDERNGPLLTNNHYFADNLAAARAERFIHGLKKLGFEDGEEITVNFRSITSSLHLSNQTSAIYDIHDTLKAYYRVAIKRFIDNVATQVVQRRLLGPTGPLSLFSSDYVASLSVEDLAFIAGEDPSTSARREELSAQIKRLQEAKKLCSSRL